ncbi:hypothetical protein C8J57DRAFT_625408 [Mycena rebaudengoi]|nr:hypothetical protein C8J57DRAFT_625408 [Mycena rebaudengoi]
MNILPWCLLCADSPQISCRDLHCLPTGGQKRADRYEYRLLFCCVAFVGHGDMSPFRRHGYGHRSTLLSPRSTPHFSASMISLKSGSSAPVFSRSPYLLRGLPSTLTVSPLLLTLIAVSRRWEHINLSFTSHGSFAPLGALSSSDVPILRTVRIDSADVDSSPELESNGWNKLAFLETPSLCRFSGWSARANFSRLPLGGEQLRHLDLRYTSLSAQEALTLLRRCPSLVTCTLYFSNDHPVSLDLGPPCRLEHLQQFCAVSSGGFTHSPQAFFESLSLPNLRVLEFFGTISVGSLTLPFLRLLSSTNGLEQLSLRSSHLTSDMIAEGLRHTPQLQELCVCYGDVDDRLLELLADTPRDLCPNLRRLRLLNMYQLSDQAILNLLRARSTDADGVANLESVYVRIHRPIQFDILPLAPPGIDLILAYPVNDEPVYDSSRGVESDGMAWAPISGGW